MQPMSSPVPATPITNLIEVHSHLIPAVDDGSRSVEESLAIARALVGRGYSQLVCTPHIWPSLPNNNLENIRTAVGALQAAIDGAGIALKLHVGGEVALRPALLKTPIEQIPTYADLGKHILVDAWIYDWEPWLTPVIRHLQEGGRTVILAHPERLGLIQTDLSAISRLQDMGVLFQGNLYCFADTPGELTREVADRMLQEKQYFMLGGDLHREDSLASRFKGFDLVLAGQGVKRVTKLLRDNPATLLG